MRFRIEPRLAAALDGCTMTLQLFSDTFACLAFPSAPSASVRAPVGPNPLRLPDLPALGRRVIRRTTRSHLDSGYE